jgi:hypothetical protein
MSATLCCDGVLGRTLESASTPASRIHLASTPSIVQHSSAASGSDQIAPFRGCSQASVARRQPPRSLKTCWQDMRARSLSGGEAGELSAQLSPRLERQLHVDPHSIARDQCPLRVMAEERAGLLRLGLSAPDGAYRPRPPYRAKAVDIVIS